MSKKTGRNTRSETSTEPLTNPQEVPRSAAQHGISIVVYSGGDAVAAPLTPDQPVIVGRGASSSLRVSHKNLSREHARFSLIDGQIFVEDLGSTYGTWIAGSKIERAEVQFGGEVTLGQGEITVRIHSFGMACDPAVEGEEIFRRRLEEEVARARHVGRSFGILAVRASRSESASAPNGGWAEALKSSLRPLDRVSLYTPDTALVLLPETGPEEASLVARTLARGAKEARLVGVAIYPETASNLEELIELAREAASRAHAEHPVETASTATWTESKVAGKDELRILGDAMHRLYENAERVASSRLSVILHGESGTGKEVLANFIHERSPRCAQRMMRVNCGAIPKDLIESTLFGHEKGAFTGASQQQKGVFEGAHEGTLFLDEIAELPLAAQAALLRVLESESFCRVGSSREVKVDVRIIAATHRDLEAMVEEGSFREDLYHRLNMIALELPPLHERQDEIEPLVKRFLDQANKDHARKVRGVADEAMVLLRAYSWPGNVRELRNVIHRAVVLARGAQIHADDLPERLRAERAREISEPAALPRGEVKSEVQEFEARKVLEALEKTGWNRTRAAELLGISLSTLTRRIKKYKLKPRKP